jgi:Phage integrase family
LPRLLLTGRVAPESSRGRMDGLGANRSSNAHLSAACAAASIDPPVNSHGLRHAYASRPAMRNVPLAVIAAQLGHTDTRMVENHYRHMSAGYVAKTCSRRVRHPGHCPAAESCSDRSGPIVSCPRPGSGRPRCFSSSGSFHGNSLLSQAGLGKTSKISTIRALTGRLEATSASDSGQRGCNINNFGQHLSLAICPRYLGTTEPGLGLN